MKRLRNILFYIIIVGGFATLIYFLIQVGAKQENADKIVRVSSESSQWTQFTETMKGNSGHPLAILLAQIVTILVAARFFGWICKKIGQPAVIGEIIAGIVLGPSLFGLYFPELFNGLFPISSFGNLQFLSQIGLILFMFIVGMELDTKILKNKAHDAVIISHASIIIPFALGVLLSLYLYKTMAPPTVPFSSFSLFIGIALSITAFPVLARIIQERGIHKTKIGTIIITCAAADDITAWCILAAVIAYVKAGSSLSALFIISFAIIYVLIMIKLVRPFLQRVGDLHSSRENLSKSIVAIFFLVMILSSLATEVIGIHALFGAFMAGAIMPTNSQFRHVFIEKLEDVAMVLFLPLFFVFTGLRTEIGLLNDISLWKITGLIIVVAIIGKFLGSAFAARIVGQNWKDSLTIGALMNTRGLMELVVLNIGYDLGVLSPEIFAMMVIMALVTTFLTGPSLNIINRIFKTKDVPNAKELKKKTKFKILVSFGKPENGRGLLRLANMLIRKSKDNSEITAMHLFMSSNSHLYNVDEYEKLCFLPISEESFGIDHIFIYAFKVTNDINNEISEFANKGDYDLLLVGIGESIYDGSLLGRIMGFTTKIVNPDAIINQVAGQNSFLENSGLDDRTKTILTRSQIPVGIFINKQEFKPDRLLVQIGRAHV
jgi:Kef-type K+ transport system membrane component KefB